MNSITETSIQFLGAVGTVTGSKYLVDTGNMKILVDCGLFQGLKELRLLNWKPLPVETGSIDAVLLTHGHLDHTGYLPLLVKGGFAGNIYCTAPTLEIAKLILKDSAKIQEEDAARANHYGYSKHKPAKPLYTSEEVERVFPLFTPVQLHDWVEIAENVSFRLRPNAHILGSVFIELKMKDKVIVFSGDIGRSNDPLMFPPEMPEYADVLLIESTYGDRIHPDNAREQLAAIINKAVERKGTIIIPSFAVERTQLLMYLLWQLKSESLIPSLPVYMDSPMGVSVLDIFHRFPEWHKLAPEKCASMCEYIHRVREPHETQKLAKDKSPKIIIAGSGMATGGRVMTYFQHYLNDSSATILLVGYQAEGTRGRALLDGAREIKMEGKYWPVSANIEMVEGLSAHGDQKDLLNWLSRIKNTPEKIFVVHGEKQAAETFQIKIKETYGWQVVAPNLYETQKL